MSSLPLVVEPEAAAELDEAVQWYECRCWPSSIIAAIRRAGSRVAEL